MSEPIDLTDAITTLLVSKQPIDDVVTEFLAKIGGMRTLFDLILSAPSIDVVDEDVEEVDALADRSELIENNHPKRSDQKKEVDYELLLTDSISRVANKVFSSTAVRRELLSPSLTMPIVSLLVDFIGSQTTTTIEEPISAYSSDVLIEITKSRVLGHAGMLVLKSIKQYLLDIITRKVEHVPVVVESGVDSGCVLPGLLYRYLVLLVRSTDALLSEAAIDILSLEALVNKAALSRLYSTATLDYVCGEWGVVAQGDFPTRLALLTTHTHTHASMSGECNTITVSHTVADGATLTRFESHVSVVADTDTCRLRVVTLMLQVLHHDITDTQHRSAVLRVVGDSGLLSALVDAMHRYTHTHILTTLSTLQVLCRLADTSVGMECLTAVGVLQGLVSVLHSRFNPSPDSLTHPDHFHFLDDEDMQVVVSSWGGDEDSGSYDVLFVSHALKSVAYVVDQALSHTHTHSVADLFRINRTTDSTVPVSSTGVTAERLSRLLSGYLRMQPLFDQTALVVTALSRAVDGYGVIWNHKLLDNTSSGGDADEFENADGGHSPLFVLLCLFYTYDDRVKTVVVHTIASVTRHFHALSRSGDVGALPGMFSPVAVHKYLFTALSAPQQPSNNIFRQLTGSAFMRYSAYLDTHSHTPPPPASTLALLLEGSLSSAVAAVIATASSVLEELQFASLHLLSAITLYPWGILACLKHAQFEPFLTSIQPSSSETGKLSHDWKQKIARNIVNSSTYESVFTAVVHRTRDTEGEGADTHTQLDTNGISLTGLKRLAAFAKSLSMGAHGLSSVADPIAKVG